MRFEVVCIDNKYYLRCIRHFLFIPIRRFNSFTVELTDQAGLRNFRSKTAILNFSRDEADYWLKQCTTHYRAKIKVNFNLELASDLMWEMVEHDKNGNEVESKKVLNQLERMHGINETP